MKKSFIIILLIIYLLFFTGCLREDNIKGQINSPVYPPKTNYEIYQGSKYNNLSLDNNFAFAINDFAYTTTSKLIKGDQNEMYSPISLYMALSMLAEGCLEDSLQEIMSVLQVESLTKLRNENEKLYRKLCFENSKGRLNLANSVWLNDRYEYKIETLDLLARDYYAHSFAIDFANPDNGKEIGKWVSKYTGGKLGNDANEFALTPDMLVILLNTIYFYDEWIKQFDANLTKYNKFYLGLDHFDVPFMEIVIESTYYLQTTKYKASSIGFKNGSRMVFVLPNSKYTVGQIIQNPGLLKEALKYNSSKYRTWADVKFIVPKFHFKTDYDLIPLLKELGIKDVFDPEVANIRNLLDVDGYVSEVIQKAYVAIDEKGCEATAYTKVEIKETSANVGDMEFNLNRPFIFAIISPSDIPLFIGVVNNPTNT